MRPALLILALLCLAAPALAQTPPPFDPAIAAEVSQAQTELRAAFPGPRGRNLSDADVQAKLAALPGVQARLASAQAALIPRLQDVDARLAQLGPAPGPNLPPEGPDTAASRRNLTRVHEAIDSEVKLARLLSVEAGQTSRALVEQLHRNFSARLWTRSRSILDPGLWRDLAQSLPDDASRLADVVRDEGGQLAKAFLRPARALLLILGLLVGFALIGPARVALNRLGRRRASAAEQGARLRVSSLALWLVMVATLTPLVGGWAMLGALAAAGALTDDCAELARLAIRAVVFAALLESLGRALLSPGRPHLRPAPVSDEAAARMAPYPGLIGAAAGLAGFVAGLNSTLGASLATSIASDCVTVLIELGAAGGALTSMAMIRHARLDGPRPGDPAARHESRLPWILAALGAWLALAAGLLSVLAGYLALATFLMREAIWIAAVLATLFLTMRFADDLFPALLSPLGAPGRAVRSAIGLSEPALRQLAVLASGVIRIILLLVGLAAILIPFGASFDDIVARFSATQFVFRIGQASISPGTVLTALGLLLASLIATRAVRGWLDTRYLPTTRMDAGVRASVGVAVSYLGVIFAVLLTFAYLGLTFSQIALLAGALSVGVGFGLQPIIANFVSGLVLLAERPVKVGDWVAIGDLEGDVRAINIRATEIEMADRSRLIVPNTDLITKTVRNLTFAGAIGRVRIVLKLDEAADPEKAREVLMGRLAGHPDVLKQPTPAVFLTDARDGALEFTALAFVASPRQAFRIKSELLFQIVLDLRAQGLALANSAAQVNVSVPDRHTAPAVDGVP